MSSARHNAYLHTRVSTLAARLIEPGELKRLAEMSPEEIGLRFGLESVLDEELPGPDRNRAVERALIRTLLLELRAETVPPEPDRDAVELLDWLLVVVQ